jgi:23S rRNA (guanine745-N1)-methyltransferase
MSNKTESRTREAIFACPVCAEPLPQEDGVFRCANGHSFDIAREGYANLLLAQHRHSRDPGYSKEMIAGRRGFFDAGYYEPLADAVADAIVSRLPEARHRLVVDAGCGEGYYLRRLRSRLEARDEAYPTLLCGMDISKHAIRVAARRDPQGLYAVAGTYHMPLLPSSADVLLTHFSPVSAPDFRRVVPVGGWVLVGGPGEDHLFGLKELVYDRPARHSPHAELADEPGFELVTTHRITYDLALRGPGQVANLLLMTPYYWSVDQTVRDKVAQLDALDTQVDVVLHAYRRTPCPETPAASEQPAG